MTPDDGSDLSGRVGRGRWNPCLVGVEAVCEIPGRVLLPQERQMIVPVCRGEDCGGVVAEHFVANREAPAQSQDRARLAPLPVSGDEAEETVRRPVDASTRLP